MTSGNWLPLAKKNFNRTCILSIISRCVRKKFMRGLFGLSILMLCSQNLCAQQPLTQVLRGSVVDKQVKNALVGATVVVTPSDPTLGVYTEADGSFRFDAVPVGTYTVTVSYMGYQAAVIPNVAINSGKETVIT